jgi:integrase
MKAQRIKSGSSVVRVFQSRSGKYVRFELRWTDHHGRLRRLKRSQRAAALTEARRIAADLARGHHHSELSLADLASFRAALVNLYGCGKTLELATAEYAESRRLLLSQLPNSQLPSLTDLAQHWLATREHTASALSTSISSLVETFLLQLKTRGLSARHQEDLRARLRKYAVDNPSPTPQHTAATVQAWTLGLAVAPRTRNNYLVAVQTLFADAALAHHPHAPAIRLIKPSVLGQVRKAIWTPAEMIKLLTNAARFDAPLVPLLALGGFAKLRASEAASLRAEDLRLDDAQAILQDGKTGGRIIPLPANCVAWLRAYAPKDGRIWTMGIDAMGSHLRKLARRCELTWRSNALRKSAQLYDTLLDADYSRVSREAGTSQKMMRRHYVDPKLATKADAEKWFEILPAAAPERVIVPMSL